MKMTRFIVRAALVLGFAALPLAGHAQAAPVPGDLIKINDDSNPSTQADTAVYYLGADNKRYVFATEKTFYTWYTNFDSVKSIDPQTMSSFALGGNVTYRPGVRMVKITTDPKVYAVTRNGILRWVTTETVATALYGNNWNQQIDDVPDVYFTDYKIGAQIDSASEFSRDLMRDASLTINSDKLLAAPSGRVVDIRSAGFSPSSISISGGQSVIWVSVASGLARVASDPHPTHGGLPGFESGDLSMGQEYKFTFSQAGNWGYHNHWTPSQIGTVNVQ